jgi:hypothetical protein
LKSAVTSMSRGSGDFDGDGKAVVIPVRGAEEGVLVVDLTDDVRWLGTGGKSKDWRTGVEAVVPGLLCMGVGGGISEGADSGGDGGTGTEWRPRIR